jgi:hypothetical protein
MPGFRMNTNSAKGAKRLERKLAWIGNAIQTLLSLIQARRALGLEAAVVVLVGIEVAFTLYEHVIRPLGPEIIPRAGLPRNSAQ